MLLPPSNVLVEAVTHWGALDGGGRVCVLVCVFEWCVGCWVCGWGRMYNACAAKQLVTLLDLCVSSLRRGHANLLCIVPILTDDPRRESEMLVEL